MFVHPELVLREQQRRHSELISAIANERQAAVRPSRHRLTTMARRAYTYASARLRQVILDAPRRRRIPAPVPADPERMAPTTPCDTPKAAATVHAVDGSRAK